MKKSPQFPSAFDDLKKFAVDWNLPTEEARFLKRVGTPVAEIQLFYEAVKPRADAMMVYLKDFGPDPSTLPPEARTILNLVASYFEVSRIFEVWDQQDVRCDFFRPEELVFPA